MANKVTIDVEARFIDNVTDEAKAAAKSFDTLEKAAEDAQKDLKNLGKTKAKPKVDLDSNSAAKKLDAMDKKLNKFGKSRTEAKLSVLDKATATIDKVTSKVKAFAGKTYSGLVKLRDSNVLNSLSRMSSGLKSLTSKAWTTVVKIKDTFTAPLTKLKNMLFNVKTLIAGIASAWAATQVVIKPINLADAYSSAQIGFSTLLGETGGQKMMDDLDEFAKVTPFKTSGVIANAQKMMAMGWDTETLIEDLEVIGNAAAATGKLDQGLESIVRALSQIKTKGKLSTEELNQLAEAGISAKAMLAENLGYGTGDEGIAKMTEDLEKGAIASNKAIEALLAGMHKYDGMMDSMANETVEGLWSQIQDVFEINIFRKWGQGLQDGAKKGFGTVTELLEEMEGALSKFGDMLYEIGKTASNWVADKFQGLVDKIQQISDSFEFQNADLAGKIKLLWKGIVTDPLKEWWENGGREKTAKTAGEIGSWMGKMLSKGLLALFGATDVLNDLGGDAGGNVAGSFVQGFLDNFDGQAIADAFLDAIGNIWDAMPWWAKALIGGYGVGKLAGGVANFAGGIANFAGGAATAIGSAAGLTGLAGYGANAAIALGAGNLAGGASLGAAGLTAIGLGSTAGGIAGGAALIKGGTDLYRAYTTDDAVEAKASKASGYTALGGIGVGAAAGAAIGSVVPVIGTAAGALIGAGIGGIAGWIGGDAWGNHIRETEKAIDDTADATAQLENEQEKLAMKAKMVWENMKDHFGDIKLSASEIAAITKHIVWGEDLANYEQFSSAAQTAEASMQSMKTASETINRWMWKGALGLEFSADEIENIKQSFTDYGTAAKNLMENKHYEWTAAVKMLVDVQSEDGKSILASGNSFYGTLQKELETLETGLNTTLDKVLADGVISNDDKVTITIRGVEMEVSEAEALQAYYAAISEVTAMVADAEFQAELTLKKMKISTDNMSKESFDAFLADMNTTIEERVAANDEAFTLSVASLNMQLAKGAITQEEYDKQLQTLTDGYQATIESVKADVLGVELDVIGDAYDIAPEKLKTALEDSLALGIDPVNWTADQARKFLNTDDLADYSAEAIGDYLSVLSEQMGMLVVESNKEATDAVQSLLPEEVHEQIDINLAADIIPEGYYDALEALGIEKETAEEIILKLKANPDCEKVDLLLSDFGITPPLSDQVLWELSGLTKIDPVPAEEVTASKFGIQSTYSFGPTVYIDPIVRNTSKSFSLRLLEGSGYRGGIFGGSYFRGGMVDNSGIVGGSTRFIRVNEESPEMIIPLSDQRRGRALKLWAQAGNIMGVPGFARGGIVGGSGSDEGIRFNTYGSDEAAGGRTVQVNMGGVKLEINVNGSDRDSIVEAIKAQAGDLADYIVGVIADSLETEFENTPVRGGVA